MGKIEISAPMFVTSTGIDAVREDKPTVYRESIFAIVKHWKEDKYFCLEWPKFEWRTLIIGGIDKGEMPEQAAIREVKEETGYSDIKSAIQIGVDVYCHFFARHKDENRIGKFKTFLVELKSDKRAKTDGEHTKNHEGTWIEKSKVAEYLNIVSNSYVWGVYENEKR